MQNFQLLNAGRTIKVGHIFVHTKAANFNLVMCVCRSPLSLNPGETYYYKYGDYYAWSPEYSFRASPAPGDDVTTTVITYGGIKIYTFNLYMKEDSNITVVAKDPGKRPLGNSTSTFESRFIYDYRYFELTKWGEPGKRPLGNSTSTFESRFIYDYRYFELTKWGESGKRPLRNSTSTFEST